MIDRMSKGLSKQQKRILEILSPSKWRIPPTVGEIAEQMGYAVNPSESAYFAVYRALRSLQRRGLVRPLGKRPDPQLWLSFEWEGFGPSST